MYPAQKIDELIALLHVAEVQVLDRAFPGAKIDAVHDNGHAELHYYSDRATGFMFACYLDVAGKFCVRGQCEQCGNVIDNATLEDHDECEDCSRLRTADMNESMRDSYMRQVRGW